METNRRGWLDPSIKPRHAWQERWGFGIRRCWLWQLPQEIRRVCSAHNGKKWDLHTLGADPRDGGQKSGPGRGVAYTGLSREEVEKSQEEREDVARRGDWKRSRVAQWGEGRDMGIRGEMRASWGL